ncbi:MAG: HNH endonuclease [Candidatus Kapaibacterium sp.]
MMNYSQQLKHPNWQRKRLEILSRDGFTCQVCMSSESTLHVHHRRYIKGRMVWEYEGADLVTLCEQCHEEAHATKDAVSAMFARLPVDGPSCDHNALGLVAGWVNVYGRVDTSEIEAAEPLCFAVGEIAGLIECAATSVQQLVRLRSLLVERERDGGATQDAVSTIIQALEGR